MKAAFLETVGGPDAIKYGDLPMPQPGPGQIRVRMTAASINPFDLYIRSGLVAKSVAGPFVTGSDFAGVVDMLGEGATRFRVGDRVWGSNRGMMDRQGTFSQYLCANQEYTYPTGAGIDDEKAAAAAMVGITAHLALFESGRLQAGETVFVNGGTGGVGSMVIQMAKASGATVVTTVGSAEKAALAKSLGADLVLNYKSDDIPAAVKVFTKGSGLRLWIETQPPTDLLRTIELMATFGRIVVMAGRSATPIFPNGPFYIKALTMTGFTMFNYGADVQRHCADDITAWMVAGQLEVPIGARMTLADGAAVHRLQEANTMGKAGTLTGKIVVTP